MKQYAVLSKHTPSVEIDESRTFSVVPEGQRFHVEPMANGDGLAVFDTMEEAEAWRLGDGR